MTRLHRIIRVVVSSGIAFFAAGIVAHAQFKVVWPASSLINSLVLRWFYEPTELLGSGRCFLRAPNRSKSMFAARKTRATTLLLGCQAATINPING